ncbi:MAG: hypothetical protein R3C56_35615 [Pirellulaceae bacterium]
MLRLASVLKPNVTPSGCGPSCRMLWPGPREQSDPKGVKLRSDGKTIPLVSVDDSLRILEHCPTADWIISGTKPIRWIEAVRSAKPSGGTFSMIG